MGFARRAGDAGGRRRGGARERPGYAARLRPACAASMSRAASRCTPRCSASCPGTAIFVGTAAVADYRPVECAAQKIKKTSEKLDLELTRTTDILALVSASTPRPFVVGFAAETNSRRAARARETAGQESGPDRGQRGRAHQGLRLPMRMRCWCSGGGGRVELPVSSKRELARALTGLIIERYLEQLPAARGTLAVATPARGYGVALLMSVARASPAQGAPARCAPGARVSAAAIRHRGLGGTRSARLPRCAARARAGTGRADYHRTLDPSRGPGAGGGDAAALGARASATASCSAIWSG